jgi:hypothetical protein
MSNKQDTGGKPYPNEAYAQGGKAFGAANLAITSVVSGNTSNVKITVTGSTATIDLVS